jgi:predicted HTH transcriptional regulator
MSEYEEFIPSNTDTEIAKISEFIQEKEAITKGQLMELIDRENEFIESRLKELKDLGKLWSFYSDRIEDTIYHKNPTELQENLENMV